MLLASTPNCVASSQRLSTGIGVRTLGPLHCRTNSENMLPYGKPSRRSATGASLGQRGGGLWVEQEPVNPARSNVRRTASVLR